jgi:hypothetical protein
MKRMQIIGLALVAVFAMSAAAAVASASAALPVFVRCAKVAAGEPSSWENSICTKPKVGTGEYALVEAGPGTCAKVALATEPSSFSNAACTTAKVGKGEYIKVVAGKLGFTSSKSTAAVALLETKAGHKVECKSLTNKGEITGPKTDKVTITFDECTTEKDPCQSGATAGVIEFKALSKLVYIKRAAPKEVGIVLEPEVAGGLFVEFKCNTPIIKETIKVKGSVIAPITPINTWVVPPSEFALTYSQAAGIQKPTEYEEENPAGSGTFVKVKDILETKGEGLIAFGYEQSGQSVVDDLLFEEAAEVRG